MIYLFLCHLCSAAENHWITIISAQESHQALECGRHSVCCWQWLSSVAKSPVSYCLPTIVRCCLKCPCCPSPVYLPSLYLNSVLQTTTSSKPAFQRRNNCLGRCQSLLIFHCQGAPVVTLCRFKLFVWGLYSQLSVLLLSVTYLVLCKQCLLLYSPLLLLVLPSQTSLHPYDINGSSSRQQNNKVQCWQSSLEFQRDVCWKDKFKPWGILVKKWKADVPSVWYSNFMITIWHSLSPLIAVGNASWASAREENYLKHIAKGRQ